MFDTRSRINLDSSEGETLQRWSRDAVRSPRVGRCRMYVPRLGFIKSAAERA